MKHSIVFLLGASLFGLTGCMNPTKPEISTIDPNLPFNKAVDAVIEKDEFLTNNLRPGFHRAADGAMESYAVTPDEEGDAVIKHLVLLTEKWCAQNGGKLESFSEIPVLQRGVGNVVQQQQNRPVKGSAHNLVCYRDRDALAAAAIGRTTFFLNGEQFRRAMADAGASIVDMRPR